MARGASLVNATTPDGTAPARMSLIRRLTPQPLERNARRRSLLLDAGIVAVVIAVISVLVKIAWPRFTFWGDNSESFLPLWHSLGTELRSGRLPLFDHERWGSANIVGEAAYGIFNPVTLVNAVGVSYLDDLALGSYVIMTEFLVLLGVGVYLLARSYGAARSASVIAAIMMPFSGFTLFYEAGNWASGLMSVTWVVHFWWTSRAYATGRMGPVWAVLAGALAATVGNPYAVLGILLVLFALALELLLGKDLRRLGGLVAVGAAVGTVVLFVYLPLIGVLGQIDRPIGTFVSNTNYLTPSLSDLLGLSSPGHLPRMRAWSATSDLVPSTYLSWLILPLIPWLSWESFRRWRSRASLYAAAFLFLLLTLGPDQLWLFRWPVRLVEYFYVALVVIVALLLSSGLQTTFRRRRLILSAVAVAATFFTAWSSNPSLWGFHLAATALGAGLVALAIALVGRFGNRAVLACLIIGTAIISPAQGAQFGWQFQQVGGDVDLSAPNRVSAVREGARDFEGSVLQISNIWDLRGTSSVLDGQLVFGNIRTAAGIIGLNNYSGIGFPPFAKTFDMDFRGSIGSNFDLDDLTDPVGRGYEAPLVDALGVSTLVIGRTMEGAEQLARDLDVDGWSEVQRTGVRIVMVRDTPAPPAVVTSGTVKAEVLEERGESLEISVSSPEGGTLLIDRLAWAGYTARVDGAPVPVGTGPAGLLEVEVPPGSGTLTLGYETPNLRLGVVILLLGALGASTHALIWRRTAAQRMRPWTPEIDDERHSPPIYEI